MKAVRYIKETAEWLWLSYWGMEDDTAELVRFIAVICLDVAIAYLLARHQATALGYI